MAELGAIGDRRLTPPEKDPSSGLPFSARHIVEPWRIGAQRFGWERRDPRPSGRREGDWLVRMGCAAGTNPYHRMPGGAARITLTQGGQAAIDIAAHEMGKRHWPAPS